MALSHRTFALASIALASMRCGGTSTQPDLATATPSTALPIASASPSSSAALVSTPPMPLASPFQAVATLPSAATLYPVEGALLAVWFGQPDGMMGYSVGVVQNDVLTVPPNLVFSTAAGAIVGITGTYPDKLDLIAIGSTGRTGIAEHYVQDKDGWSQKVGALSYSYVGFATTKDSLVALKNPLMPWPHLVPSIDALRGPKSGHKLTPPSKSCPKPEDAFGGQATDVFPSAFGGTGAGTLFSMGTRCDRKNAVELWPAGSKTSTITTLPENIGTIDDDTTFASGPGDTAWMFGDKVLFFDGATWAIVEQQPGLTDGDVAPDGVLWAIGPKGTLYKGTTKGFEKVAVPNDAVVDDVAVMTDGTVWISAGDALLRTKKTNDGASSVQVAKESKPADKKQKSPPKFGGPQCKSNVVVLYGFTKVTPDDYDFPLTRKALKGHAEFAKTRFVVTKDYGQKFFSALVPSFEEAKKLVSVIEKAVQGSKPQIVCADPEVLRELKIDFTTGDLIK